MERVGPLVMVGRGLRKRCARCGARGMFASHFKLHERCPTCGYRFSREEGFVTGVFLVNFGVTLAVLWVVVMGWVLWRSITDSTAAIWPVLAGCIAVAIVVPVVFYPRAAATWAALDLAMRPLEPEEEATAATWLAAEDRRRSEG